MVGEQWVMENERKYSVRADLKLSIMPTAKSTSEKDLLGN
jgi:hypothetical protein